MTFCIMADLRKPLHAPYPRSGKASQHGRPERKQTSLCNYCQWDKLQAKESKEVISSNLLSQEFVQNSEAMQRCTSRFSKKTL